MGRQSDYSRIFEQSETREFILDKKLNAISLKTEDLAKILKVDPRTVRNYIARICEVHSFSLDDFKDERGYTFPPKWHGLLLVILQLRLLAQDYGKSEQHTLEQYLDILYTLVSNVDKFLPDSDQKLVKNHFTYQRALLEEKLYDTITTRLGEIVNVLGLMPPFLRFQILLGINRKLTGVPSELAQRYSTYLVQRALHGMGSSEGGEISESSFVDDLEEYLVSLIKLRMRGEENVEDLDGVSELPPQNSLSRVILEQMVLGNLTADEHQGLNDIAMKTREQLLEQPEVKETFDKILGVLDQNNPIDMQVMSHIKRTILLMELSGSNSDNQRLGAELMRRVVTEQAMRDLQEFNEGK